MAPFRCLGHDQQSTTHSSKPQCALLLVCTPSTAVLGCYPQSTTPRTNVCLSPLDTRERPFRFRRTQAIGGTSASLVAGPEADRRKATHCRRSHLASAEHCGRQVKRSHRIITDTEPIPRPCNGTWHSRFLHPFAFFAFILPVASANANTRKVTSVTATVRAQQSRQCG
jgi:hypothetical protein